MTAISPKCGDWQGMAQQIHLSVSHMNDVSAAPFAARDARRGGRRRRRNSVVLNRGPRVAGMGVWHRRLDATVYGLAAWQLCTADYDRREAEARLAPVSTPQVIRGR